MDILAVLSLIYPGSLPFVDYTFIRNTDGSSAIVQWLSTTLAAPTQSQLDTAWATVQVQQAKEAQIALLQTSFNAAFTAPVSYMSTTFPADPSTQQLLVHAHVGKNAKGGVLPAGFYVKDVNQNHVSMTAADLDGLLGAIFDQGYAAWDKMNTLVTDVMAATTVSAVQAVVW